MWLIASIAWVSFVGFEGYRDYTALSSRYGVTEVYLRIKYAPPQYGKDPPAGLLNELERRSLVKVDPWERIGNYPTPEELKAL